MNRKSGAVLDVGSAKVTVLIGERGVNKTFVFKGVHSEKYDGYANAAFFDTKDLQRAVAASLEGAERNCGDRIRSIYVGVPGEFSRVINSRCMTSFRSKRRVTANDVDVLFANGFYEPVRGFTPVRQTAVCYVTSDRRRTIDPVGMISDSLEGYLCYFLADDRYIEILRNILLEYGVREVHFLPAALAEALYVAISADTGNFSYGNTTAGALRLVADMVEEGLNLPRLRECMENNWSEARLRLWGRVMQETRLLEDGRLAAALITRDTLRACNASREDAEGLVEQLRRLSGVRVALMLREEEKDGRVQTKASLRSSGKDNVRDVAAQFGGGGHRNAAGATLPLDAEKALTVMQPYIRFVWNRLQ